MNDIISFVKSLYETGFTQFFNWLNTVTSQLTPNPPNTQITTFMGAFLDVFIPFPAFLTAVTVYLPLMVVNFAISLILRVKSFVPTMGGK